MKLYPFQIEGRDFLASRTHAAIFDEMGVGKTAQAVAACDAINAKSVLVVCPAIARINWAREFEKFSLFPRENHIVDSKKFVIPSTGNVIVSPEILIAKRDKFTLPWDVIIVDEAHYFKAKDTQRTKALFDSNGIARKAKRLWALTGTPAPNNASELWVLARTFGATPLAYSSFVSKYCNGYLFKGRYKVTGTKKEAIPEIKKMVESYSIRRTKEQVMPHLPPIYFGEQPIEASPIPADTFFAQQFLYPVDDTLELKKILGKELARVTDVVENLGYSEEGLKLLEAISRSISTLRLYTGLQKVKSTVEIVTKELFDLEYEKVVIFAHHNEVIDQLQKGLASFGAEAIYGKTPPARRQYRIDQFNTNPRKRVLVCSIAAAGTAISLTAAHNLIFVEQSYVPGDNAQAAMRVHRNGQTKPVFVRVFYLRDSYDAKVSRILKQKSETLSKIFLESSLQKKPPGASD